jgi:hypothetical protein
VCDSPDLELDAFEAEESHARVAGGVGEVELRYVGAGAGRRCW